MLVEKKVNGQRVVTVMFVAHVMFVAGFLTDTAHTTPSKPETKLSPNLVFALVVRISRVGL